MSLHRAKCAPPWIAVALAAIACYAATIGYALVQDDRQVLTSPLLSRPFDILAVWRNEFLAPEFSHLALYRPLSQWTLLLNVRANELLLGSAGSAAGFHAVNVLLHAGASLLLLAWLRTLPLRRGVPFLAALLFAVHPIHSEAVASVSARSEPLALLFGMAFLLAHRRGRTVSAALFYLAAMWSKESAAGFLVVAIAADVLFREEEDFSPRQLRFDLLRASATSRMSALQRTFTSWRGLALGRWLPCAGVLALWLTLRELALRGAAPAIAYLDNPAASASAFHRVLTAAAVQVDYLRLLLWPHGQSVEYAFAHSRVVESATDPRALVFAVLFAASVAAAFVLRRRAPLFALGVVGYASLFAVTSNFLFPIGTIEAERLAYMPSSFFCLLAAAALVGIADLLPKWILAPWLTVLVLILGMRTVQQNTVWKDEGTLIRSAVATAPHSAKAHLELARTMEVEGALDSALLEYKQSIRIYAGYGYTWFFLGNLLHRLGDGSSAVDAWRAALSADPSLTDVRANLVSALLELSRRPDAVVEARELFARDPLHARLPEIADRLAATATPEEHAAALDGLAIGRTALARNDASNALARIQDAIVSGALARAERREALELLSECWRRLGREAGARKFAEAARRLSAPGTPADPAAR